MGKHVLPASMLTGGIVGCAVAWSLIVVAVVVGGAAHAGDTATVVNATDAHPIVTNSASQVFFPVGDWISWFLNILWTALGSGVVGLLYANFSGPLKLFISEKQIENYVHAAITQAEGAAAGKVVSADIANSIVRDACNAFIADWPKLGAWAGPKLVTLAQAVLSKLEMAPATPALPKAADVPLKKP